MTSAPESVGGPGAAAAAELQRNGYAVLRRAVEREHLLEIEAELTDRFERTPYCEGAFSGARTKRFHGLLKRTRGALDLVLHVVVRDVVDRMLLPNCDTVQLNLTQAIEIHPGEHEQVPHRDQDMWQAEKGHTEFLVNVMWPITSFRPANGGTILWPGSHRRQEEKRLATAAAVSPQLNPGDALLFLGSTLHCAGANRTDRPRRGIVVSYCLGWLKPYENPWLTYPPEIARSFPRALSELVGYRLNRPNLGNYDGNCPSVLLDGSEPEYLATRDEFLPAQLEALERYRAERWREPA